MIGAFHTCFYTINCISITCYYGVFKDFNSSFYPPLAPGIVLSKKKWKEGQNDEFMGCTMAFHGYQIAMDGL